MILRGVDGCPGGWLAASLDLANGQVTGKVFAEDAVELLHDPRVLVTAIDIPIGLPGRDLPRRVDAVARGLLKGRASTVFPAPPRAALGVRPYASACDAAQAETGKRMSQQAFAILPKIEAVDKVLRESPELVTRVFEVHPELCFYFWASQEKATPIRHPKHSGFGFVERFELVRGAFGRAAEEIRETVPRAKANDDDILDALAALWTARRIHAGIAVTLPEGEERLDEFRLPMRMLV